MSVVPLDSVPKLNYRFVGFGSARKFLGRVFFLCSFQSHFSHGQRFLVTCTTWRVFFSISPWHRDTVITRRHRQYYAPVPRKRMEYAFSTLRTLLLSIGILLNTRQAFSFNTTVTHSNNYWRRCHSQIIRSSKILCQQGASLSTLGSIIFLGLLLIQLRCPVVFYLFGFWYQKALIKYKLESIWWIIEIRLLHRTCKLRQIRSVWIEQNFFRLLQNIRS